MCVIESIKRTHEDDATPVVLERSRRYGGLTVPPARGFTFMMKPEFPYSVAMEIAVEIMNRLRLACERLVVAGSLRRQRLTVGDIELLYIPRVEERGDPGDMFARRTVNLVDIEIATMEREGVLVRRKNTLGREMFGSKNKLMVHVASGIRVDLFSTTVASWWNYLVCRTGPAELNERICCAAKAIGWKWRPYEAGFARGGEMRAMGSEEEVFAFVGLAYMRPGYRV